MGDLNWSHQAKLFDPKRARPVTVLGAGSVGSQVACLLAKAGAPSITLYDSDDVRSHNLPMTLAFRTQDLGRLKVEVVSRMVREQSGVEIKPIPKMYEGEKLRDSVICCVDTMEARALVWKAVRMNPVVDLFVDTRIHERFLSLFAIRPCDADAIALYESRLYPTSQTEKPVCGRHGIGYVSVFAAALAVRALTGFWSGDTPLPHVSVLLGDAEPHVYT